MPQHCYGQWLRYCWGEKEAADEIVVLNDDVKLLFVDDDDDNDGGDDEELLTGYVWEEFSPRVVTDVTETHSVRIAQWQVGKWHIPTLYAGHASWCREICVLYKWRKCAEAAELKPKC